MKRKTGRREGGKEGGGNKTRVLFRCVSNIIICHCMSYETSRDIGSLSLCLPS